MGLFTKAILVVALGSTLAACQTSAPGAVGAGYGAGYTPVIDGAQGPRFHQDLAECRQLAAQVEANRQSQIAGEAIAGALAGALTGRVIGGNRYSQNYGARVGALSGAGHGAANAAAGGKQVIMNCMVGRGYRVLADAKTITDLEGETVAVLPFALGKEDMAAIEAAVKAA